MDLVMKKEKKTKEVKNYKPKTQNQENYMECLTDDKNDIVIGVGPAGTGKTLFACLNAISKLKDGSIRKIVITRPVVTVEEEIGFLPGNINKKMDPWIKPLFDLFLEFFTKTELDNFVNSNLIEISPIAFMRGRTFKNAYIIADEMQNSSPNQMKMLTTRIGTNSKMVITGDLHQSDIQSKNGLSDLIEKINSYNSNTNTTLEGINVIYFDKKDIERSDIVKKIIKIYEYEKPLISNVTNTNIITTISNKNNSVAKTSIQNYNNNDDAAMIPKSFLMRKGTDIFFDDFY
jgi:phosphate starvation-inducible PhoH-like protein